VAVKWWLLQLPLPLEERLASLVVAGPRLSGVMMHVKLRMHPAA
jgi:hypothetical protein